MVVHVFVPGFAVGVAREGDVSAVGKELQQFVALRFVFEGEEAQGRSYVR